MNAQTHINAEKLLLEVTRYLAAIEVFRAERCEPTWIAEAPCLAARKRIRTRAPRARSAH